MNHTKYIVFTMCLSIQMGSRPVSSGAVRENQAKRKHAMRLAAVAILFLWLIAPGVWAQNTVQTIAGGGPNNLPAAKASMGDPSAVVVDSTGNVYVADIFSNRIFRADSTGNLTVVAGNGARGGFSDGDGGPVIIAKLTYPSGVTVDSFGNIFPA